MKLVYLFNGRLPTEKAHGVQIVKMCEAFGRLCEVKLVLPYRWNTIKEDVFVYYSLEKNFAVHYVWALDLMRFVPERIANALQTVTSLVAFWIHLPHADQYYVRDYASMALLAFLGKPFAAEFHDYRSQKPKKLIAFILKKAKKIIANSEGTKALIMKHYSLSREILVAPNAVDPKFFDIPETKQEARNELGLPQDKIIIGYVGRTEVAGRDKGVGMLKEAFASMKLRAQAELLLVTSVPYRQVPLYLRAIDIAVIPFSNQQHAKTTSPIKLFEYMAARKTIVVADGPDPQILANKLDLAVSHPQPFTGELPTWNQRAKNIYDHLLHG